MFAGCFGSGRNAVVPRKDSSDKMTEWDLNSRHITLPDDLGQSDAHMRPRQVGWSTFDPSVRRSITVSDKLFTGGELISKGFKGFNAESLPRQTQPITFMVLDIIRSCSQRRGRGSDVEVSSSSLQRQSGSGKFRNRLVPIFTNRQCQVMQKNAPSCMHATPVASCQ